MEKPDLGSIFGKKDTKEKIKIGIICVGDYPSILGIGANPVLVIGSCHEIPHCNLASESRCDLLVIANNYYEEMVVSRLSESLPMCELIKIDDKSVLETFEPIVKIGEFSQPIFPELIIQLKNTLLPNDTTLLIRETRQKNYVKHDIHRSKCNLDGKGNKYSSRKSFCSRKRG